MQDGRDAGGARAQAEVEVLVEEELRRVERAEPAQRARSGAARQAAIAQPTVRARSARHGSTRSRTRARQPGRVHEGGRRSAPAVPGSGWAERWTPPVAARAAAGRGAPAGRRRRARPAAPAPSSSSSQSGLSSTVTAWRARATPGVVRRAEPRVVPGARRPRRRAPRASAGPRRRSPCRPRRAAAPGRWARSEASRPASSGAESCRTHDDAEGLTRRRPPRARRGSPRAVSSQDSPATARRPAVTQPARRPGSRSMRSSAAASARASPGGDEQRAVVAEHLAQHGQVARRSPASRRRAPPPAAARSPPGGTAARPRAPRVERPRGGVAARARGAARPGRRARAPAARRPRAKLRREPAGAGDGVGGGEDLGRLARLERADEQEVGRRRPAARRPAARARRRAPTGPHARARAVRPQRGDQVVAPRPRQADDAAPPPAASRRGRASRCQARS